MPVNWSQTDAHVIHGDNDDAFCIVWRPFRAHSFAYNILHINLTMMLVESRRLAHTHCTKRAMDATRGRRWRVALLLACAVQRLPKEGSIKMTFHDTPIHKDKQTLAS